MVAIPEIDELTIVVPAAAVGAEPLLLDKAGTAGYNALNNTYPLTVAPVEGKLAAVQDKLISSPEKAVADKELAADVGGFDKVLKLLSLLNPVAPLFVA